MGLFMRESEEAQAAHCTIFCKENMQVQMRYNLILSKQVA